MENDRPHEEERLAGERALAQIERAGSEIRTKADQFESREEALRERFQQTTR